LYYNDFMTMLAGQLPGTPAAAYARQWLSTVGGKPSWYIAAVDNGGTAQALNALPLDYYATGPGYLYARSGWSPAASGYRPDSCENIR
jgi:hypothetical protein